MPRRSYRRRQAALSDCRRHWLLYGNCDFAFIREGEEDPEEEELRALWAIHGPELLAEFLKDHAGSRPWAWWEFSAPEPRGEEDELDYLRAHKLLDAAEKRAIAERITRLGWTVKDFPWLKAFANA